MGISVGHCPHKSKIEVPKDVQNSRSENMTRSGEDILNILEKMQVRNRTGPGVRRSKRPLLANRTNCNVLWKPPEIWK